MLGLTVVLFGTAWADDKTGSWGEVIDWNLNPIHAVLSPEKKLLTFGQRGGAEYSVWDFEAGTGSDSRQLIPNTTPTDLFCSAQIVLPQNGTVMTAGGDQPGPTFIGNTGTTFFDGSIDALFDAGFTMANPRWYPTLTTLPNGEILVQGGRDQEEPLIPILTPEVFNPDNGWRSLLGINSEYAYAGSKWWYPRSWVIPNGLVFGITGRSMYHLDYQNDGKLLRAGDFDGPNTFESSTAVMYQPGKILQLGGGREGNVPENPATNLATLVDVTEIEPVITDAAPLHLARHWPNSTVLPDGTVLVTGGSQLNNSLEGDGPTYAAEIWNPDTNSWSLLSAEVHARLYHSFAILLPDATILSAGGGEPGPIIQRHGQIFTPPYLFNGDSLATRPEISVDETELAYGGVINVQASTAESIDRLTLVKTGAVTHSFNNDQRFIELSFVEDAAGTFNVQLPDSPYVATPGYYYLFALNEAGTPSVAEIVHFAPDASIELPPLPELIDPQDLLENCVYPPEGGWGYDAVAQASCRPLVADDSIACDYSQADQFGGHGWNASTQRSCPPLDRVAVVPMEIVDACDYSRADEFDGFGFNPVTLESCPPLGSVPAAEPYPVVSADLIDPEPVVTDLVVDEEITANNTSLITNIDVSDVTQVAVSSGGTSGGGSLGLGIFSLLLLVMGASLRKSK